MHRLECSTLANAQLFFLRLTVCSMFSVNSLLMFDLGYLQLYYSGVSALFELSPSVQDSSVQCQKHQAPPPPIYLPLYLLGTAYYKARPRIIHATRRHATGSQKETSHTIHGVNTASFRAVLNMADLNAGAEALVPRFELERILNQGM